MDKNQQYILINRFLTGDISESENNQLQHWLQESIENQKIFDEVEKIWCKINTPEPETIPPFEEFWGNLNNQLETSGQKQKASVLSLKKVSSNNNLLSLFGGQIKIVAIAAAAMLILLIGGYGLYQKIFKATNFQIYVTQNRERAEHRLPDGTKVILNSASEIKFAKDLLDSVRTIQLTGQAFFEVIPDGRPFFVQTKNAQVQVLGTGFDVRARDLRTCVIVKHGKVALLSSKLPLDSGVVLTTNEMSICQENESPTPPKPVDAEYILGWLEDRIVFENTPVKEIAGELQRIYDVKIKIEVAVSNELTISGEFEQEPVDEILSSICLAMDLKYYYKNGVYLISQ